MPAAGTPRWRACSHGRALMRCSSPVTSSPSVRSAPSGRRVSRCRRRLGRRLRRHPSGRLFRSTPHHRPATGLRARAGRWTSARAADRRPGPPLPDAASHRAHRPRLDSQSEAATNGRGLIRAHAIRDSSPTVARGGSNLKGATKRMEDRMSDRTGSPGSWRSSPSSRPHALRAAAARPPRLQRLPQRRRAELPVPRRRRRPRHPRKLRHRRRPERRQPRRQEPRPLRRGVRRPVRRSHTSAVKSASTGRGPAPSRIRSWR